MSERGVEFKVGLLILSAIVVAGVLIFVLGGFSLRSGYSINVDYNFSGNIKPGAPVKLAGIKVGKVEEVKLMDGSVDPETGRRVLVRLDVADATALTAGRWVCETLAGFVRRPGRQRQVDVESVRA